MSNQSNNNQNGVKDAIKAYLDKRAQDDTLFAASYAKQNKSIDECFEYIVGEVRKKGNMVYLSDEMQEALHEAGYNPMPLPKDGCKDFEPTD